MAIARRNTKGRFTRARSYSPRRKGSIRRRGKMTIPIVGLGGLAIGIASTIPHLHKNAWHMALYRWIPYNTETGKWFTGGLPKGLYPALAGYAVHLIANKLGFNRMLSRARIPLIRI